jgi:hypothetical protein
MTDSAERMKLYEKILTLIDHTRTEVGDPSLGDAVERLILNDQFREIQNEIFENPGAIEPWLIRRRRGS